MPFKKIKRAFKKITKPVAKVLDKVVPNEIKPFLPYAAAFVPFAAPASFGIGSLSPMVSRALLAGGANLAAQLSQEGSEGDFSGLSALLAAGTGYLSTPGAADQLRGMTAAGQTDKAGILKQLEAAPVGTSTGSSGFLGSAKDFVLNTGAKAAEALNVSGEGIGSILAPGGTPAGFNMETLSAAAVPFTQGSIDLGIATARKALKDYELELDAFNAQAGANQAASDADRRAAIISSMTAANFTQDIIDETLGQLGLKDGGRVGFDNGGDVKNKREEIFGSKGILNKIAPLFMDEDGDYRKALQIAKYELGKFISGKGTDLDTGAEWYNKLDKDTQKEILEEKIDIRNNRQKDFYDKFGFKPSPQMIEEMEMPVYDEEYAGKYGIGGRYATGGIARLGFDNGGDVDFGGIKEAIKGVAQNNMEEGVTQMYVSDSAGVIPLRDGDAVTGRTMEMMAMGAIEPYGKNDFRDPDGYERFIDIFTKEQDKNKELNEEGMKKGGLASYKDGGIMNLGGKEMDMRTGGFIPIGAKERADDVPARLSKNEFVMTADAVRAAGGGSVNKGAKRMYDLMHNLEARA
jgi:hypothetical protein